MSIKEVEAVLGQPSHVEPFPIEMQTTKELQGVRYYYKEDGRTIELHFVDNKLIRRIDRFGETPAPEEGGATKDDAAPDARTEPTSTESEQSKAPSQPN